MTQKLPHPSFWARVIEGVAHATGGSRVSLDAGRLIESCGGSFEDPGFRPALESFCGAFDGDRSLTFLGRRALRWMILDALRRRQRVERDVRKNPEITAIPITRPILIVGPPRTGTTFLQQLLALDPQCRWLRPWEIEQPYAEKSDWGSARDKRRSRHEKNLAKIRARNSAIESIHPVDSPAECWQLLWDSFSCHTIFLFFGLGDAYRRWQGSLSDEREVEAYRFYRLQLQHMTWMQARKYWVLKAPEHTVHLRALLEVFPDAQLIQLHREPAEYVPSLCNLAWHCQFTTVRNCNAQTLGSDVVRTMSDWARINLRDRERLSRDRVIDVAYRDLVANPSETVRNVYRVMGIEFDSASRNRVEEWIEANRRSRKTSHQYSLDQFGLGAADLSGTLDPTATVTIQ
jgi:hypothetical protein